MHTCDGACDLTLFFEEIRGVASLMSVDVSLVPAPHKVLDFDDLVPEIAQAFKIN